MILSTSDLLRREGPRGTILGGDCLFSVIDVMDFFQLLLYVLHLLVYCVHACLPMKMPPYTCGSQGTA